MMTVGMTRVAVLIFVAAIAGCSSKEKPKAADSGTVAPTMSGMKGMDSTGGMRGMQGMAGMSAMMDTMQVQMTQMMTGSGDQMKGLLPMHRQMVANMLSQMFSEMRSMNMPADAAWTALADSVRQDLVHLPDMSASELKAAMLAHAARVARLMEMH